jgi:hypothetical protein
MATSNVIDVRVVSGKDGKGKPSTSVGVWMGDTLFATATLGGRYNVAQAAQELRKQPQRFTAKRGIPVATLLKSFPIAA